MRIIISGTHNYKNWKNFKELLHKELYNIQGEYGIPKDEIEIVHGGASGIDTYAEWFAKNNKIKYRCFPSDWDNISNAPLVILKYQSNGKPYNAAAGTLRNKQMLDYAIEAENPILIAFPRKDSKGTKDMIKIAKQAKIDTRIIEINP